MGNFLKGLVHGFGQNYDIFLFPLFRQNTPKKKVSGNVLYRKLAFQDYKNMDLKEVAKLAIFFFSPWFRPKV